MLFTDCGSLEQAVKCSVEKSHKKPICCEPGFSGSYREPLVNLKRLGKRTSVIIWAHLCCCAPVLTGLLNNVSIHNRYRLKDQYREIKQRAKSAMISRPKVSLKEKRESQREKQRVLQGLWMQELFFIVSPCRCTLLSNPRLDWRKRLTVGWMGDRWGQEIMIVFLFSHFTPLLVTALCSHALMPPCFLQSFLVPLTQICMFNYSRMWIRHMTKWLPTTVLIRVDGGHCS